MHAHVHSYDPLATDPVCGMRLAPGGPLSEDHRGTTYWFCDPACAAIFREEPGRWTTPEPLTHDHADQDAAHHA